ncbi:MAG TPA: hypothetical protein VHM89_01415 [Acidimicrobiales bacterium]|nr:hypothetical protein [Acidimicrobiales bacterium]
MLLVDEYVALPALVGRAPEPVQGQALAMTYGRTYRLTRALLDPGPGRLQVRGRPTRLVDGLSPVDQHTLHEQLADPDPRLLTIVDPRPLIRATGAIQNTYALSMLQAETLAAALTHDWAIRFADAASAPDPVRRAAEELGLDLQILP